ncbi:M20 family metallopeptidase [Teichococcus vastitatis]|uniref:M20 family metallopeptidase n=1 Tax=Teichococcus vastitatis TaxID=2307076 RepID=A0ABS9WB84_9PROT|nr:M20 family metallopeptidase [Pseudoroseomonas vastitatis]MCI0756015.1 M20 family metallopeptidase [Pseudoroseomonas vastitatis]
MNNTATRDTAIAAAVGLMEDGRFRALMERRVAFRTESQVPEQLPELHRYLDEEIIPSVAVMGFASQVFDNPVAGKGPFLIARRIEDPARPTVLIYGHGDVTRGQDAEWREGLAPFCVTAEGDRWYGRGTADNKGQHSINLAALEQVMQARGGRLGFNVVLLLEMGEETGSPGLSEICVAQRELLKADVLIASDGPRLSADRPTLFLGSRGAFNVELRLDARERGYHSGNWGGVIVNPATVLANAIASMTDARGRLLVDGLRPPAIPNSVRAALAGITLGGGPTDPAIDANWGEPGLTPAERLFAWNTLEVLAFKAGNADAPVNAVPPRAVAVMQLRFVVGTDAAQILPALRAHLDAHGFGDVELVSMRHEVSPATRLDPDSPWVRWAAGSMQRTSGSPPAILPNIGGTLPNHVFADLLALPTLWVPHSYAACAQHAPDEHMLVPLTREALALMAGLFWDLGDHQVNM